MRFTKVTCLDHVNILSIVDFCTNLLAGVVGWLQVSSDLGQVKGFVWFVACCSLWHGVEAIVHSNHPREAAAKCLVIIFGWLCTSCIGAGTNVAMVWF